MNRMEKVIRYYRDVDAQDVGAVVGLFADDAIYVRADVCYAGKRAIERFYREQRLIRGVHVIDRCCQQEASPLVLVTGEFKGQGADEQSRQVRFSDIWEFDDEHRVCRRETYLALGHGYVQA